jgi:hypothetical protein
LISVPAGDALEKDIIRKDTCVLYEFRRPQQVRTDV